jgi:Zn-dependent oligopeptidase
MINFGFEKWCDRLRRLMVYYEYISPNTKISTEDFRPLFEQGMKPLEALDADMDFRHPQPQWSKVVMGLPKSSTPQSAP